MVSPLQGALAARIGRAFANIFYEATVQRTLMTGPIDPGKPQTPGARTTVSYPCKGIVDTYSDYAIAETLVDAQDRKILILATSISIEPTDGDRVVIRGETYMIISVKTDPAKAVWELQCRA